MCALIFGRKKSAKPTDDPKSDDQQTPEKDEQAAETGEDTAASSEDKKKSSEINWPLVH